MRHGRRGLVAIDGDPNKLGACAGECHNLSHGSVDVGRIRICHGLDGDWIVATDRDRGFTEADPHADGAAAWKGTSLVGVNELRRVRKG